jgi:rare lipoprotein A
MAWQRLLCVGFCAVALPSIVYGASTAYGAPTVDTAPPPAESGPVLAKKPVLTPHRVKPKVTTAKAQSGKATKPVNPRRPRDRKVGQVGYASWYGGERHGKSMASGGPFDKNELTAAHRTLPMDSKARVTNMANGRSVTVRITDRGPSRQGRIIDLSQSAAEELGMRNSGVARVHVEPVIAGNMPGNMQ